MLLMELQETEQVRENSTAWGELRASAVFETELREALATSTRTWTDEVAETIRAAQDAGCARPETDSEAAAQRLTALVEGVSMRWLSGSLTLEQARELLLGAIELELGAR